MNEKNNLRRLLLNAKKINEFKLPDTEIVRCFECKWDGVIKDCNIIIEQEGWENPPYETLECPKCGSQDLGY